MRSMKPLVGLAACLVPMATAAGCLTEVTGTRPVTISVSADVTTPTVGQTVTVSFAATGTGVAQVVIDFGDGESTTKFYGGPVEVTDFATHSYAAAGPYLVSAEVVAAAGSATDTLTITVS